VYRWPEPQPDGRTGLRLTPLELIERLAALIPPPRLHRHRYHGGAGTKFAAARAGHCLGTAANPALVRTAASGRSPARYLWALLLARIYEILPLRCTQCGAQMRIIAFITHAPAAPVQRRQRTHFARDDERRVHSSQRMPDQSPPESYLYGRWLSPE
jgi:hypothetical protein